MREGSRASLRPFQERDAAETVAVFERAIQITAARDYTPAQVAAWIGPGRSLTEWAKQRSATSTCVATLDDAVVGFTDIDASGHIDMLYVDPAVGRRGVGTALLAWALDQADSAGNESVTVHASFSARPLFELLGFKLVEQRTFPVRGVWMTNFAMEKRL